MTAKRVTLNLTRKGLEALDAVCAATGDNQTDTVIRALRLYAFAVQVGEAGGHLSATSYPGAEPVQLVLL